LPQNQSFHPHLPSGAGQTHYQGSEENDQEGDGKAELKTVEGGPLTAIMKGGKYILTDEKGGTAMITIPNVIQSNGVIQ